MDEGTARRRRLNTRAALDYTEVSASWSGATSLDDLEPGKRQLVVTPPEHRKRADGAPSDRPASPPAPMVTRLFGGPGWAP